MKPPRIRNYLSVGEVFVWFIFDKISFRESCIVPYKVYREAQGVYEG